jgi:hypothetical protein
MPQRGIDRVANDSSETGLPCAPLKARSLRKLEFEFEFRSDFLLNFQQGSGVDLGAPS